MENLQGKNQSKSIILQEHYPSNEFERINQKFSKKLIMISIDENLVYKLDQIKGISSRNYFFEKIIHNFLERYDKSFSTPV